MKLELNQVISNRYQIIEQIGVGGMANVYCANDTRLDRKVTFKVLKEEFLDDEFIEKFNKEATAAAKISYTNIANVYDFGNDGNIYYIVMEYVDGFTLKDIIKVKSPFSNEEILGISMQIANALLVAHNSGIVHRDIKPQNILISKDGQVKVTDFGIARAATSNTITVDTMGSVHYFSPEQARGGFTDFKSDIYSLGIVMYEMATGKIPFDGDGVVQLAMKHINEPLPDIRAINPNISESLEKIILKATQKNSDNRYKSTELLIDDLKKALYDESGDFVVEEDFADSTTVVITPEQIEMINKLSANSNTEKNEMDKNPIKTPQIKSTSSNNSKNTSNKESTKNKSNKSKERKVTILAILTGLSIVTIITTFLIFSLIIGFKVSVPNFVGQTFEEAAELAKENEIYIRNIKEEYSDEIPEGSIIAQDTPAGSKVDKGDIINITLSLGSGKFELADFVGMDIAEVYRQVQDIEITLIEKYINSDDVTRGKVISQTPEAGEKIIPSDEVTLYISKGAEETYVLVPNLTNLKEADAKAIIRNLGLSVGNVTTEPSNSVEEGKVIRQGIAAGKEVEEGTSIGLVISSGKPIETTTEESTEESTEEITEESTEELTEAILSETSTEETSEEETSTINYETTLKDATLVISPSLEGEDPVEVKIVKVLNGEQTEIYVRTHVPSDFPLVINVRGSEPTEFRLYIDGKLIGSEMKFN